MSSPLAPQFAFAACQHGAEAVLKTDLAKRAPTWRPAFSRPGFVTFKNEQPVTKLDGFQLSSAFARTSGLSLGSVEGETPAELAAAVWQLPEVAAARATVRLIDWHVWQRDVVAPGERGFEPGPTPVSQEAEAALRAAAPEDFPEVAPGPHVTPRNRWVLDVIVVEPNHWWVGCHYSASRPACWPGGVPPIELPEHAVSRAYLKMSEALWWSALPASRGEQVVELGCAPGGASQALLDAGLLVIGVDPARVAVELQENPLFQHVCRRVSEAPRSLFKEARWLTADMNVAPAYTLDAVESVVTQPGMHVRGMLLTLKLPEWQLVEELPNYLARIQSWGYRDVRVRQLAFNRQELCVAALRSRGQRRVQRESRRRPRQRADDRHSTPPKPLGE